MQLRVWNYYIKFSLKHIILNYIYIFSIISTCFLKYAKGQGYFVFTRVIKLVIFFQFLALLLLFCISFALAQQLTGRWVTVFRTVMLQTQNCHVCTCLSPNVVLIIQSQNADHLWSDHLTWILIPGANEVKRLGIGLEEWERTYRQTDL